MPTPAPHPSPTSLLAVARLAATRAGDHARCNGLRRQDVNTISRHDVKHKLDVECQTIATQTILAAFPGHAILGEETAGAERPAPAGVEWIIDPIDGTVNFFHGLPYWCCSVAARLDGVTQAGFVYAPEMGLAFEAASDGPALCNGQPLQTSACTDLARALVHTGTDKADGTSRSSRFFDALAMVVQRPRIMGAAALDICFVAKAPPTAISSTASSSGMLPPPPSSWHGPAGQAKFSRRMAATAWPSWPPTATCTVNLRHACCR